jgi:hypothetical protein
MKIEANNYVGFSDRINCVGFSDRINCVGRTHPVSMDHWMQIKEKSEDANNVVKEYDNVTKLHGQNPTPEQTLKWLGIRD